MEVSEGNHARCNDKWPMTPSLVVEKGREWWWALRLPRGLVPLQFSLAWANKTHLWVRFGPGPASWWPLVWAKWKIGSVQCVVWVSDSLMGFYVVALRMWLYFEISSKRISSGDRNWHELVMNAWIQKVVATVTITSWQVYNISDPVFPSVKWEW